MILNSLILLSFINVANAGFEIDEQFVKEASIPCSNPALSYELRNNPHSQHSPAINIKYKENGNGKFIGNSSLTFEEKCVLAESSPSCINLSNSATIVTYDPDLKAIKSSNSLRLKNGHLQLNNCVIISQDQITLEADHIQVCAFFKTPKSISLKSITHQNSINEFILTPNFFNFDSICGMSLLSSSVYASIDVNFKTNQYNINWQSASLTIKE